MKKLVYNHISDINSRPKLRVRPGWVKSVFLPDAGLLIVAYLICIKTLCACYLPLQLFLYK